MSNENENDRTFKEAALERLGIDETEILAAVREMDIEEAKEFGEAAQKVIEAIAHVATAFSALAPEAGILQDLQDRQADWAEKNWGRRGPSTVLMVLLRELDELREEPFSIEEYADVALCLIDALHNAGYRMSDLLVVMQEKFHHNRDNRTWDRHDWGHTTEAQPFVPSVPQKYGRYPSAGT